MNPGLLVSKIAISPRTHYTRFLGLTVIVIEPMKKIRDTLLHVSRIKNVVLVESMS
jgi:hypothetical protein